MEFIMAKKTIGSKITDRLERFAANLVEVKNLDELQETLTVRKVVLNLSPRPFTGDEISGLRKNLRLSQAVLAEFLGVSVSTVQDWEQGINVPSGPARRILEEMYGDTEVWRKRIRKLATSG